jgi:hypothetical protein
LLGLNHTLINSNRSLFGLIQGNNEFFIGKNVFSSLRHQLEDLVLEFLKLSLEITELNDELIFLLLKLWLFILDDFNEELIFKTIWSYCEIDDGDLNADLW